MLRVLNFEASLLLGNWAYKTILGLMSDRRATVLLKNQVVLKVTVEYDQGWWRWGQLTVSLSLYFFTRRQIQYKDCETGKYKDSDIVLQSYICYIF